MYIKKYLIYSYNWREANQKVEAEDQADSGVSFSGRTVVEKFVKEQTGSNTPDADGSYNSQIKDISVVSTDGNKVRYRINFKDGFTIPKDGYVHFFMESAHQFANATDLYMGKTNVARLANGKVTGTSKEFADSLKGGTTLAGFRDKLEKASSSDVFGTSEWKVIFNENFEKLNKDRYVEFVIGSYNEAFNERNLPFLYIEGVDKAKLFSDDTIIKKYENKVILPSVADKAIAAPYNKLRYPIADTTSKLVDNPTYTSNSIFNLTTNPGSSKKLPIYIADANYGTGFIIKSVVATDVSKVDQAKNLVNVKYVSTFESKTDSTLNNKLESKNAYIPIRGTSLSSTGVKLEFKTTQWRDIDTNKNLKASKVDTKTYPADKIENYSFVRTDTDPKTGNIIHFYRPTGVVKTRDDLSDSKVTRFLEEGTNKALKDQERGDKFVEAGTIAGYTFVRSEVKGDVTTHYFKKAEEPKKPEAPKTEEPKKEEPKTADVKTPDKKDAVKTGANASVAIAPFLESQVGLALSVQQYTFLKNVKNKNFRWLSKTKNKKRLSFNLWW